MALLEILEPWPLRKSSRLADSLRTGHVESVVDQRLHAFEEAYRMRQLGVILERRFILPARMNVEQSRVASRLKSVNVQAARLLARRTEDVAQPATAPSLPGRA